MCKAIVHFDGGMSSRQSARKTKIAQLSWGIVLLADDTTIEKNGCLTEQFMSHESNYHEMVALFESVQTVYARGLLPEECSSFTGGQLVAEAGFHLRVDNGYRSTRNKILHQLEEVATKYFSHIPHILDMVCEYLTLSRVSLK